MSLKLYNDRDCSADLLWTGDTWAFTINDGDLFADGGYDPFFVYGCEEIYQGFGCAIGDDSSISLTASSILMTLIGLTWL